MRRSLVVLLIGAALTAGCQGEDSAPLDTQYADGDGYLFWCTSDGDQCEAWTCEAHSDCDIFSWCDESQWQCREFEACMVSSDCPVPQYCEMSLSLCAFPN